MGSKSDFVPESFIKALQRGIGGYRKWTQKQQWRMAKLVWEEGLKPSHYTHLPPLYPIVLSDEHRERADELGEAGV